MVNIELKQQELVRYGITDIDCESADAVDCGRPMRVGNEWKF